MSFRFFTFSFLLLAFFPLLVAADIDDVSLVQKLKKGGYVILVRHAMTDRTAKDADNVQMGDCGTQRNLNAAGRKQAADIGKAVKAMAIPIGKVYSSEYCRCIETAELAFGTPETRLSLSSFMHESTQEQDRRVNVIQQLLATAPAANTNNVLVTHSYMQQRASNVPLQEGAAAVFMPTEKNKFQLIAKLPAARWQKMLDKMTSDDEMW